MTHLRETNVFQFGVMRVLAAFLAVLCLCVRSAAQNHMSAPHRTFDIACDQCHTTSAWGLVKNYTSFDHSLTAFALDGEHKSVACNSCHHGQGFKSLHSQCASCHEDIHRAEFGPTCENCHSPTGWRTPGKFITLHEATRFPLLGAHRLIDCRDCHTNQQKNEFAPLSVECVSCHYIHYETAKSVSHIMLHMTLQCQQCHKVEQTSWAPATYDHSRFLLVGIHASLACQTCHTVGFQRTSINCIDCHRLNYDGAKNPLHAAGNYPTNCVVCHSSDSWRPASFNHALASFTLTGKHIDVDCGKCHVNGQYTGMPKECVACHQQNFTNTKNPNHVTAKFSTTCSACHTMNSWIPATFDHKTSNFPLTGSHQTAECAKCHVNQQWSGLNTQCIGCHQTAYNNVVSPNHRTANFPIDCTPCHTTMSWKPSTFDHDGKYFPVNSGKHRGKWSRCEECHTTPSNIKLFSCTDCHAHDVAKMDKEHKGKSGYTSNSADCYRCHPKGN